MPRSVNQGSDDGIATHREPVASRRRFLGAGLVLGGSGLVALGASPLASAVQNASGDDVALLNVALALEHLEAAFYREGLRSFDEVAFAELGDDPSRREMLQAIRDHEQAHVEALAQAITDRGGSPVEAGNYDFGYVDLSGFLQVGAALENIVVGAYAELATAITDTDLLAAALGIHSVEARHAAYLSGLRAESPFPNAFDEPRSREEVESLIGGADPCQRAGRAAGGHTGRGPGNTGGGGFAGGHRPPPRRSAHRGHRGSRNRRSPALPNQGTNRTARSGSKVGLKRLLPTPQCNSA